MATLDPFLIYSEMTPAQRKANGLSWETDPVKREETEKLMNYELAVIFGYLRSCSRGKRGWARLKVEAVGDSFKIELTSMSKPVPVTPELEKIIRQHRNTRTLAYGLPWYTLNIPWSRGSGPTGYELSKCYNNSQAPEELEFSEEDAWLDMAIFGVGFDQIPKWLQEAMAS